MTKGVDLPLMQRGGHNIGTQPGQLPFVQGSGSPQIEFTVPESPGPIYYTVIMEGTDDDTARTPQVRGAAGGWIVNGTNTDIQYSVLFEDDQGNQAPVSLASPLYTLLASNSNAPFQYGVIDTSSSTVLTALSNDLAGLVLCKGEKLVLAVAVGDRPS